METLWRVSINCGHNERTKQIFMQFAPHIFVYFSTLHMFSPLLTNNAITLAVI